jgi:hypothetical protein
MSAASCKPPSSSSPSMAIPFAFFKGAASPAMRGPNSCRGEAPSKHGHGMAARAHCSLRGFPISLRHCGAERRARTGLPLGSLAERRSGSHPASAAHCLKAVAAGSPSIRRMSPSSRAWKASARPSSHESPCPYRLIPPAASKLAPRRRFDGRSVGWSAKVCRKPVSNPRGLTFRPLPSQGPPRENARGTPCPPRPRPSPASNG